MIGQNKINRRLQSGGGGANATGQIDLQNLSQADIESLMQQGIMPEQLAEFAQQQGQPVPPIIMQMMTANGAMPPAGMEYMAQQMEGGPSIPQATSTKDMPAMMDLATYSKYREMEKKEQKLKPGAHKPNVYGYMFSDLISQDILRDMKKTQGSFLIGVNLNNLFNVFREMIISEETGKPIKDKIKDSDAIFKEVGEYYDVDFKKNLDRNLGFRGSDIPLLPERELTDYSSFYEILQESKKYSDKGAFHGKITPLGLLIMTRMLYKYRKNNAQWVRVATVLELIYKYLGKNETRKDFFKNKDEISILSLRELEEFYNTDHLFMTPSEIVDFKKELQFYKYDKNINIQKELKKLKNKPNPII